MFIQKFFYFLWDLQGPVRKMKELRKGLSQLAWQKTQIVSNPLGIFCLAIYIEEKSHKDSEPCNAGGSSFGLVWAFSLIFMAPFCVFFIKEN